MDPNTELASGFTVGRYRILRPDLDQMATSGAWSEVLGAVRRRIRERFLIPINGLARFDKRDELPNRPGFAIMALDCLLIDTIQSFREGRVSTGEVGPAKSFSEFLKSPAFPGFSGSARSEFFQYVRNAILHNGETRKDWKIRIDRPQLLYRDPVTHTRTINRRLFHAGVLRELRKYYSLLASGEPTARKNFLRRMDAMAGLPVDPKPHHYFAYGSNLVEAECSRTAPSAEPCGRAFLPRHRLAFTKHSETRDGDAATIVPDDTSIVWGFLYRVHEKDRDQLRAREIGYDEKDDITVFFDPPGSTTEPIPLQAFTFVAAAACPQRCGPTIDYLNLVIAGAMERGLPEAYVKLLSDLRGQVFPPAVVDLNPRDSRSSANESSGA